MRAATEEIKDGFYLDRKDEHVDLLLHAAAKALSEIYEGSYEFNNREDGWVGIRVYLNPGQAEKVAGPERKGKAIKKLIVDFEKQEFGFER